MNAQRYKVEIYIYIYINSHWKIEENLVIIGDKKKGKDSYYR